MKTQLTKDMAYDSQSQRSTKTLTTPSEEYTFFETQELEIRALPREDVEEAKKMIISIQSEEDKTRMAGLYATVGLLTMEIKRLHWKLSHQPQISEDNSKDETLKTRFADLDLKFNMVLQKLKDCREEAEKHRLAVERLEAELKEKNLEIGHLKNENEQTMKASFVEHNDVFSKYRLQEETIAKLESKKSALEDELEQANRAKGELGRLHLIHSEKMSTFSKVKAELQATMDELEVAVRLVETRDKELQKLNEKNNELLKVAQEYSHVKQLLEIVRRDVDTYREAFENREKTVSRLTSELAVIDDLNLNIQEKTCKISFLEDEVKRLKEKMEEKDTQIELFRLRIIDQDLEKFKNSELTNTVNQLKAKLELSEKVTAVKNEENNVLQSKLLKLTAKVEELSLVEVKLEQVSSERNDLLNKVFQLKNELLEIGRLQKQLQDQETEINEHKLIIGKNQKKIESQATELKESKTRLDQSQGEVASLRKDLKDFEETKFTLGATKDVVKELKEDNSTLKTKLFNLQNEVNDKENQTNKLRNELKETSESLKTKLSMLEGEKMTLEDKIIKAGEVEKKFEKLQTSHADLKVHSENLQTKVKEYEEEVKSLELNIERLKDANSSLENRINILREVETRNKELAHECEKLGKESQELQVVIRKCQLDISNLNQDKESIEKLLLQAQAELRTTTEKSKLQSESMQTLESHSKVLAQQLESCRTVVEELEKTLGAKEGEVQDWQGRYQDLRDQFDRYIAQYEQMNCKFERMSAVNEDHVKDIENKAFHIAQLQKKNLILMIELARIDSLRSPN